MLELNHLVSLYWYMYNNHLRTETMTHLEIVIHLESGS